MMEGEVDGRHERRRRNRAAVVEAMLSLYEEGILQPSSEQVAARSGVSSRSVFRYFDDVEDLARTAVRAQQERVRPLAVIDASPDDPLDVRVRALVAQRVRLLGRIKKVGMVSRVRAPFEPVLLSELTQTRSYLRHQIEVLFRAELSTRDATSAADLVAALDVATSFEAHHLLGEDIGLDEAGIERVMLQMVGSLLGVRDSDASQV
jgi:AcrR family transcriptional regulator